MACKLAHVKGISEYFSNLGKKGGKARAKNLSEARATEIAKKAARVRWAKERERKQKENG